MEIRMDLPQRPQPPLLQRWRAHDGECVRSGAPLADVAMQGAVVIITAPCSGRLSIVLEAEQELAPDAVLGHVLEV